MDGKTFALKRTQAERSVKRHIDKILSAAAESIVNESKDITLVSSEAMFSQLMSVRSNHIMEAAEEAINDYITAYSKASIDVLGDKDTGATGRLLSSDLFGKTFRERSHTYMQYFFRDIIKMIIAGKKLKLSSEAIKNSVTRQYQDPYINGIINKARQKGFNTIIPSYGRGIYRSAYGNILRNAQGTIAIAWEREQYNKAKRDGAVAFRSVRGSSYLCATCDDEARKGIRPLKDFTGIYHVNCCCVFMFYTIEDLEEAGYSDELINKT